MNIENLKSNIYILGNNPTRFPFAVKLIRRLLFPFIKPYLFVLIDQIEFQKKEIVALKGELIKIVELQVRTESDLCSLKNRLLLDNKNNPEYNNQECRNEFGEAKTK